MKNLNEGISFDETNNKFVFDFKSNKDTDIIVFDLIDFELVKSKFYNNVYYFGYEFTPKTSSKIRTKFFHEFRFNDNFISKENRDLFIANALKNLNKHINLNSFGCILFPKSRSNINSEIIDKMYKLFNVKLEFFELIKELPGNIEFDYNSFSKNIHESYANGKPRYIEKQKEEVKAIIGKMMYGIHNSDYFSIAESVKKNLYKPYFKNYLKFKNKDAETLFLDLQKNKNILVIDDVATTGSTLFQIIKTIRGFNISSKIVLFTLVGKKQII